MQPTEPSQTREFEPTIHTDLAGRETYGDYLRLDMVLGAQQPRSMPPHHDEMLFIIQHQTSELWIKLLVHELDEVIARVRRDNLEPSFKILARVAAIQQILFQQWSVLETLTPSEYLEFRDTLGTASGLQSHQYRVLEFVLGNKDEQALKLHRHTPEVHALLEERLHAPSLYDEFLRYLKRRGAPVPDAVLERDFSKPYAPHPEVADVFRRVYEDTHTHWDEYEMCEKLLDVEQRFQLWRFRHMMTVQRIIGFKPGTGGSSGVGFLRKALDHTFFPELWDARTLLGTRDAVPR